jgi:hypothetical protein
MIGVLSLPAIGLPGDGLISIWLRRCHIAQQCHQASASLTFDTDLYFLPRHMAKRSDYRHVNKPYFRLANQPFL